MYKATKNAGIDAARPWCCGGLLQRGVMHFSNIWARVDVGRYNLTYLACRVIACLLLFYLGTSISCCLITSQSIEDLDSGIDNQY